MTRSNVKKNSGFSLLELLLAIGILGVIAVFAVAITNSSRNLAKVKETKNRMLEIRQAALDYYEGRMDLPAPAASSEVPVGVTGLNLEQKHRLDAWGRYFHYSRVQDSVYTTRTDITGISVENRPAAGVIVSSGPDQVLESVNNSSPYMTAGDDIVLAISVHEQAMAIAMNDLRILQDRVQALDAMFAGVDNDSDKDAEGIDENGCAVAIGCPQTGTANDPNCSTATLDSITASFAFCGFVVSSPAELIAAFYDLGDSILLDPWLHPYIWGDPATCGPADPCYHRFFSFGPDNALGGNDDIVP